MAATVRACSKRVFSRSSGHTAQRSRSLLPSIATTMWASWLSKESTKAIVRLQPAWSLDTGAYESLKPWVHAENLRALDAVRFSQPAIHADQQYLDVGCGSGSFTKEALLPRVRPECRRIVAVDRCKKVLHDARENFSDEHIVYDTMDIENHDPGSLTERYGAFDRVYSFLTFHYVADITKAYGNVCKLLKQGGECLVLSVVKADAIDVWNEVYQMEEWNALIITLLCLHSKRITEYPRRSNLLSGTYGSTCSRKRLTLVLEESFLLRTVSALFTPENHIILNTVQMQMKSSLLFSSHEK
ncbi:uncharacterized protein LOC119164566 isoform X6 [Rhipicephalus microplus]|uniref:uncharacterized protein LOC119164566 isoform X6 n=1 Tax=Rhipicephalus microplus TaxID=6941 RepID=UPI003F6B7FBC